MRTRMWVRPCKCEATTVEWTRETPPEHVRNCCGPALFVSSIHRRGNDNQSLVCHGQRCYITCRKTLTWSHTALLSQTKCRLLTESTPCVCCASLNTFPNTASRSKVHFTDNAQFIVVPMADMLCLELRIIHISPSSWNITCNVVVRYDRNLFHWPQFLRWNC